jgi:hypothetical protein
MSITIFGFIVCVLGLALQGVSRLYFLVICSLFGATAAAFLGSATVNPAIMAAPFFMWLVYTAQASPNRPEFDINLQGQSFWILLFTVYATLMAYILPRIFNDGSVIAYMNDRPKGGTVFATLEPLRPVSTNITQSLYLISNVAIYLGACYLLAYWKNPSKLADAFLVTAGVNVFMAFLNMLQQFGVPDLLFIFKNGAYVIHGGSVGGLVRISGAFPETSAWSAYTLGIFGFVQALWANGYRVNVSAPLTILTLVFLLLSTSGTAYGGLAIMFGMIYTLLFYRRLTGVVHEREQIYFWGLGVLVFLLMAVMLFSPHIFTVVLDFFELTVVGKSSSESGQTRASWNINAWQNVIDTYGFGTGLGSNISSGFTALLFSNTGWFGALLFGMFLKKSFFENISSLSDANRALVIAGRWGMVGVLSAAIFSARVFDLGMPFFLFAAAAGHFQFRRL